MIGNSSAAPAAPAPAPAPSAPTIDTVNIYIARQPILNGKGKLYAYELLFRSGAGKATSDVNDATKATAQVMNNSFSMGIEKVVGAHKAFINCDRGILLGPMLSLLDPKVFVLEILEDVEITPEIVAAVKNLYEMGFNLALDDFIYCEEHIKRAEPLMPFVRLIKVDLLLCPREDWAKAAAFGAQTGKVMLAEKVETSDDFAHCKNNGYHLFQGYFFAKPELMESGKVDTQALSVMRLLQTLRRTHEVADVERAFKSAPDLMLKLLQFINSAAMARRFPIKSVQHAITMLGLRKLEHWLMLMIYVGSSKNPDELADSPLFNNVTQRAVLMQGLAEIIEPTNNEFHEKAFLVGVMSRISALFRLELPVILDEFRLDEEINDALLDGAGKLGEMLVLVDVQESGNYEAIQPLLAKLKVSPAQFITCIHQSFIDVMSAQSNLTHSGEHHTN